MRDTQIESFTTSFLCTCFVNASLRMKILPSSCLFVKKFSRPKTGRSSVEERATSLASRFRSLHSKRPSRRRQQRHAGLVRLRGKVVWNFRSKEIPTLVRSQRLGDKLRAFSASVNITRDCSGATANGAPSNSEKALGGGSSSSILECCCSEKTGCQELAFWSRYEATCAE